MASFFSGSFGGGGSFLDVSSLLITAGATGVVAQLQSPLPGALTFSQISGVDVTVASDGAVTFTTGLAEDAERVLVARVQNDLGDAIERSFTFVGYAEEVALPTIESLTLSAASGVIGTNITATVTLSEPAPVGGATVELDASGLTFDPAMPEVASIPEGQSSVVATYEVAGDAGSGTVVAVAVSGCTGSDSADFEATDPVIVPVAPTITDPGTIAGTRGDGNLISGTAATATGTPSPAITYQWEQELDAPFGWTPIFGADQQLFEDDPSTATNKLRRAVIASNSEDSVTAYSNILNEEGYVEPPIEPPVEEINPYVPVVSNTATGAISAVDGSYVIPPEVDDYDTWQQHLYVGYFKWNVLEPTQRSLFNFTTGDFDSNWFSVRQSSGGTFEFRLTQGTGTRAFSTPASSVDTMYLVFAQMSRTTNNGRTDIADRARLWVKNMGSGEVFKANVPTTFNAAFIPSGMPTVAIGALPSGGAQSGATHGFHWVWNGPNAALPLIDFDDPAVRDLFEPTNLDPVTGTVDFGGAIGEVTPQLFYHGDVDEWNTGLANKGSFVGLDLTNVTGTHTLGDFDSAAPIVADPVATLRTEVVDGSVTFTFNEALTTGQFADGSYWVDPGLTGEVTAVSPPSVQSVRPWRDEPAGNTVTTGLTWSSGMMVNPGSDAKLAAILPGSDVFGSSEQAFDEFQMPNNGVTFRAEYNLDPGRTLAPVPLVDNDVLYKFVSRPTVSFGGTTPNAPSTQSGYMYEDTRTLTVVDGGPPTPAPDVYYQPGLQGGPFIWVKREVFNLAPFTLVAPVSGMTSYWTIYNNLKKVRTGCLYWNHGQTRDYEHNSYGREASENTTMAVAHICNSANSLEARENMAAQIIQYGIWQAHFIERGTDNSQTTAMGNTSSGRKLALVAACLLTGGEQRLLDALATTNASGLMFAEDIQMDVIQPEWETYWAGQFDTYDGRVGGGEWSGNTNSTLNQGNARWVELDGGGVQYRHNWCVNQTGTNNFLHHVPELGTLWGNDTYRNAMDFYWAKEQARGFAGESGSDRLSSTIGNANFYRQFRQSYGALWTPVGPLGVYA